MINVEQQIKKVWQQSGVGIPPTGPVEMLALVANLLTLLIQVVDERLPRREEYKEGEKG